MLAAAVAAAALALAGCGGAHTPSTPGPSRAQRITFNGRQATLALASPTLASGGTLPTAYTCDGADLSPPLAWGPLPAGTRELALFALAFEGTRSSSLTVEWALAGLSPAVHALAPGQLPRGAIVGRNGNGHASYTVCPARGTSTSYLFILYALPRPLAARPGFHGSALLSEINALPAAAFGALISSYTRA
jgi:phosphatidylethanolamine-binding protein (PEBP) family uncharacterized protein